MSPAVLLRVVLILAPGGAGSRPAPPPAYRGFSPGMTYRAFSQRARALSVGDTLRCNTSANTAQLMECGVRIRDPKDSARFYLSAYVIEGRTAMVALFDSAGFGDKRGTALVDRRKRDLTRLYGEAHAIGASSIQWAWGRQVVRLSWRGRGTARWVSITLSDNEVMDGISRYVRRSPS